MAIKKYNFLAVVLVCLTLATSAQTTNTDWGYDWKDSSLIPVKSMPQYNEFLQNKFPYPPQPRNAWELGFSTGYAFIAGDTKSGAGIGGGITIRKAISHTFSFRLGYFGSLNYGSSSTFDISQGRRDYKNETHSGAFEIIASLNSISNHRGNPKADYYVLGGYTLLSSRVMLKDAAGTYRTFYGQGIPNSQSGSITTLFGATVNNRKAFTLVHGASFGGGVAFKVNNKTNIGLEQRFVVPITGYDLFDGRKGGAADIFSFTSVRLNLNIGNPSKK